MPADHAPQKALVSEVIEALVLAVALTSGMDEGEAPGRARFHEAFFQRDEELLGNAVPAIAGGGEHVTVVKHGDRILDGDDLLQHGVTPRGRLGCARALRGGARVRQPVRIVARRPRGGQEGGRD